MGPCILSRIVYSHPIKSIGVCGPGVLERWLHPDRLLLIDADRGTSGKFALQRHRLSRDHLALRQPDAGMFIQNTVAL